MGGYLSRERSCSSVGRAHDFWGDGVKNTPRKQGLGNLRAVLRHSTKSWCRGFKSRQGHDCCSADNPVDGFDASRATTARRFTPRLCMRTTADEGSTYLSFQKVFQ